MAMRKIFLSWAAALLAPAAALAVGNLENPTPDAATVSGVSMVSGWHCTATRVEIEFDGALTTPAASGTDRLDTLGACGKRNTGFGLLLNWAALGPGVHTLKAFADGVEFGSRTVTVVGLGAEFLTGKGATVTVNEFPSAGRSLDLEWQEGMQSFVARGVRDAPRITGIWNGANLERRSNCSAAQNNGAHGTYAQWNITLNSATSAFRIVETGITGLDCTYAGVHRIAGNRHQVTDGTYTCTDGKRGAFTSTDVLVSETALSIRLAIKLSGSETCDIDAIIGGSRF